MATVSPAPAPGSNNSPWHRLLEADAAVTVTSAMTVFIIVLTTFSRRSNNSFLHILLTILSRLYIPVITYTLDYAYQNLQFVSPLFVVSGVLLQLIIEDAFSDKLLHTSTKEEGTCDDVLQYLKDEDDNISISDLTDICWLVFLLANNSNYYTDIDNKDDSIAVAIELNKPTYLLLVLSSLQLIHNKIAFVVATRAFGVGKNSKVVARYMDDLPPLMEHDAKVEYQEEEEEECGMSGCFPYIVKGEEKQTIELSPSGYNFKTTSEEDLITVRKVWECEGRLLHNNESNREVCLSFALFKLLRASVEKQLLAEHNTRYLNLVLHGPFKDHKRAFRIVERELQFMDDYLHSRVPITNYSWFAVSNIILRLLFLTCCSYIGFLMLHGVIRHNSHLRCSYLHNTDLPNRQRHPLMYVDITVFLMILFAAGFVEGTDIIRYIFSDHVRVVLLCKYVKNYKRKPLVGKVIELLYPKLRIQKKLWSNELRQYSLLRSKREKTIKLSDQVKEAIVVTLRDIITLQLRTTDDSPLLLIRNQVCNCIPQAALVACRLDSYTERILVWHIATTRCEENHASFHPHHISKSWRNCKGHEAQTQYFNSDHMVASNLSRYCAYLVVYAPKLLPDDIVWTKNVVREVKMHLRKQTPLNSLRFRKLTELKRLLPGFAESPKDSSVQVCETGEELGKQLIEGISEDERRWKMLAEVWAEIVLSVASSTKLNAHAESSRKGGEFITHVWSLLSNVGIIKHHKTKGVCLIGAHAT